MFDVFEVLATHASSWVHRYSSLLQWSVPLGQRDHVTMVGRTVYACVARTWISYLCVPCHPWCIHRKYLVVKKNFFSFPVAMNSSTKVGPLIIFFCYNFVITENIMKRPVVVYVRFNPVNSMSFDRLKTQKLFLIICGLRLSELR
jgi:hypothetical protein